MIFNSILKNIKRRYWLRKTTSKVMKDYLSVPFISQNKRIGSIELVSLDIETTGLNPETDKILSIGLVNIDGLAIKLDSHWHQYIQHKKNIPGESVVIHQVTDDISSSGVPIDVAIQELLIRLKGKVVIVHNKTIEQSFINKACQNLYDTKFIMPVIDTQFLARRSLSRKGDSVKKNELRLFNLRKKYNLPAYKAHNALYDAIAAAELFLAMIHDISNEDNAKLFDFM